MQLSSRQEKEIRDLVAAGQRILAVKRCREITGLGLNESMQLVNRIAAGGADASSGRMTISASNPLAPWTVITRMRWPSPSSCRFTSTSSVSIQVRKPVRLGTADVS